MFRSIALACAVMILACCTQSQAAEPAQPPAANSAEAHAQEMLSHMIGHWELTGTLAGAQTVHDVDATWALQRKYVEIREVSHERGADGQPAYEAIIYVGWLNDHYVCFWFDNTAVAATDVRCEASGATANVIPLQFRNGQGELIFLNTFSYQPAADTWTWAMDNPDGTAFGRVTLRRH